MQRLCSFNIIHTASVTLNVHVLYGVQQMTGSHLWLETRTMSQLLAVATGVKDELQLSGQNTTTLSALLHTQKYLKPTGF